jgi:hypothetical protein
VPKPQFVDRALKGDQTNASTGQEWPKSLPSLERASKQVRIGCDRAGSTSAPQFSALFGRCLV